MDLWEVNIALRYQLEILWQETYGVRSECRERQAGLESAETQSEPYRRPDFSHFFGRQGRYYRTDLSFGHRLQMIAIDSTIFGNIIQFR